MKLEERVQNAVQLAMAQEKNSCTVDSNSFECNISTTINLSRTFEQYGVRCWVEQLHGEERRIWLQWGNQIFKR